jgi:hypothetical protein
MEIPGQYSTEIDRVTADFHPTLDVLTISEKDAIGDGARKLATGVETFHLNVPEDRVRLHRRNFP